MAESSASDRSEQATPERLRKAREEGQIPQSHEVTTAVGMLAVVGFLAWGAPGLGRWCIQQFAQSFAWAGAPGDAVPLDQLLRQKGTESLLAMAPFLGVVSVASVAGSLLAGGWTFAPKAVQLNFGRLSPGQGLRELFSAKSSVQIVTSLTKLVVLSVLVWTYLRDRLGECFAVRWASPSEMLAQIAALGLGVLIRITAGLVVIAGAELVYQRYSYKKRLRMTRQEVKEERRQHELAPEVRGRIRSIRIAMARRRMLRDVPKADVVLANPTHVAVAMRYSPKEMQAPQVLAKGADLVSDKIKEIARAHNIPVIERPELARTIYATVEVGQTIPETLFVAVAEVLAMVYRLRGKRRDAVK
jgi:flagellar biosynthesis protein FlhB